MVIIYLIIAILLCYSIYITIRCDTNKTEKLHNLTENEKKLLKQKLKEEQDAIAKKYGEENKKFEAAIVGLKNEIEKLKKEKEYLTSLNKLKKENIDIEIETYRKEEWNKVKNNIQKDLDDYLTKANLTRADASAQITEIIKKLKEYKEKSNAINNIIFNSEKEKKEVDLHKIILPETSINDIEFLLSIENKINNKEILRKLIWSNYLQKPFNDMIKTQFGAKVPEGVIYCIENTITKKKYIGKTVAEVNKRWSEHIKSSLNIGTISHQKIHEVMFGHWTEFTFSIIEIVEDKKQLSEREKYYIDFFETDKFGYNLKRG